MSLLLSLGLFIRKPDLFHQDQFGHNALDLLGRSLEDWLNRLLTEYGVPFDTPIIRGDVEAGALVKGRVFIAEGAKVEPGAYIMGPAFIGPGSEVRHCAYIRGNTYVGRDCVVGHTTEVKGSCFFDGAKAGHFAYVGDSLLGCDVNLGAGTKLANLRLKNDEVTYLDPTSGKRIKSGLRKFGAILGDNSQTGCNAVLSPGSLLMPGSMVYPCAHFHGTLDGRFVR